MELEYLEICIKLKKTDIHILICTKTHLAMVNVIFAEMCGHRQLQEKQLSDLILT